jgi:protein-tyrosine-phosphatase
MPSLLIVCTANQCRSPMGMVLLRRRIQELGLEEEWNVDSAGTWGFDGAPATITAVEAMRERGLDLEDHQSRKITGDLLETYDLVLTMTRDHQEGIQTEFPQVAEKVYMLSEMLDEHFDIVDPVGSPLESYRETADQIDRIFESGMDRILELARANRDARFSEGDPAYEAE